MDVGNLISGSSAISKSSLNIWKFSVHVLLKPSLANLSITLLVCEVRAMCAILNRNPRWVLPIYPFLSDLLVKDFSEEGH